jgi:hypothetical protein
MKGAKYLLIDIKEIGEGHDIDGGGSGSVERRAPSWDKTNVTRQ